MADISIQKFEFTKNWNNPTDFPTYQPDEAQVRADLQELHDQTRNYFNNVLLQAIIKVIEENQEYVQQAVADAILGTVPEKSIEINKLACVAEQLSPEDAEFLPTSEAVANYVGGKILSVLSAQDEEFAPSSKAVADYIAKMIVSTVSEQDTTHALSSAAVVNYVKNYAAPVIKHGTSDVTDGSASSYPEGTLYVVLE